MHEARMFDINSNIGNNSVQCRQGGWSSRCRRQAAEKSKQITRVILLASNFLAVQLSSSQNFLASSMNGLKVPSANATLLTQINPQTANLIQEIRGCGGEAGEKQRKTEFNHLENGFCGWTQSFRLRKKKILPEVNPPSCLPIFSGSNSPKKLFLVIRFAPRSLACLQPE